MCVLNFYKHLIHRFIELLNFENSLEPFWLSNKLSWAGVGQMCHKQSFRISVTEKNY